MLMLFLTVVMRRSRGEIVFGGRIEPEDHLRIDSAVSDGQHRNLARRFRRDRAPRRGQPAIGPVLDAGIRAMPANEIETAEYGRKQVVEIMRQAARKLPHRLHLFSLNESSFGFSALCHLVLQLLVGFREFSDAIRQFCSRKPAFSDAGLRGWWRGK